MPTTITLKNLGAFAGATNLQLFLRKTSDNTLLAAGGDTGVDADSIGSFAWTIAEEIPAEQLLARIYEGATETAATIVIDSVLNVGFTEIGQEAAELNSTTLNAIADAVLARDWEAVTGDVPSRSVLNALRHIRNKWALDGATKTVYAEDGTTPAFTTTVTADGAGNITADTPND